MNLINRKLVTIVLSIFIMMFIIIAAFFIDQLILQNALQDVTEIENLSPEDKRKIAHRVLKRPISFHHDAYIILIEYGNEESIPYLLNGLKWYDFFNHDGDFTACTKDHCLEALRRITGKDLGTNYSDWKSIVNRKQKIEAGAR